MKDKITVETTVNAPIEKVWECWNNPEDIKNWAFASDDWEVLFAENDLKVGGSFKIAMSAKDKSAGFDFVGKYNDIKELSLIEYNMDDGRNVKIIFEKLPEGVRVIESFDPEDENSLEIQKSGWQAILDNFKRYVEIKIN